MPRKNVFSVNTNLTKEQRDALQWLIDDEPIAVYLRRLIAEDAKRRGLHWPDHPGRGRYPRKKQ
jgi:hypothetical protein